MEKTSFDAVFHQSMPATLYLLRALAYNYLVGYFAKDEMRELKQKISLSIDGVNK